MSDKAHPATTSHNYQAKVLAAAVLHGIRPGALLETNVSHDDWCDALNNCGFCNCDPTVTIIEKRGSHV